MARKIVGYVFTLDGKPLVFRDFILMDKGNIEEVESLFDSRSFRDVSYLRVAPVGSIECDAFHAFVKFEGEMILGTVFKHKYL